ncbi:MAG: hypothetical protein QM594_10840 [Niabella sp.]
MKTITPFLLRFAMLATVLTIIFRYFLSYGIDTGTTAIIVSTAILYGLCMFMAGWYWGKKDGDYLPIHDVGFRFHLATFLVHNAISELWFILGLNSKYERIETIHITAICWSILLLLHFILFLYARKNTINSLDKTDLFE